MIHQTLASIFLASLSFFLFSDCVQAKVPAIIVFGDSTVDAGNNNYLPTLAKSNFKPYGRDFEGGKPTGRFCNGRLVTDFLSEAFGIKPSIPAYLDPGYSIQDFASGVTFASAGTGYDNLTSSTVSVIPFWKELEYFKNYEKRLISFMGKNKAKSTLGDALYLMSLGTNDFILNYYAQPGRQTQFTIEGYEDYLIGIADNFVREIYRLGARKVAVAGLPPVGCLPIVRALNVNGGGGCRADYNNLARDFDGRLQGMVAKLSKELIGSKLLFTDVFTPALQVINNPHTYGFESVDKGCCGTGTVEFSYMCSGNNPFTCIDASKYVFWDAMHPTEKLYHIVADHLMKTTLAELL